MDPYPWRPLPLETLTLGTRGRVFRGKGKGPAKIPQGYPWCSLSTRAWHDTMCNQAYRPYYTSSYNKLALAKTVSNMDFQSVRHNLQLALIKKKYLLGPEFEEGNFGECLRAAYSPCCPHFFCSSLLGDPLDGPCVSIYSVQAK